MKLSAFVMCSWILHVLLELILLLRQMKFGTDTEAPLYLHAWMHLHLHLREPQTKTDLAECACSCLNDGRGVG
jgi:hypothetical protein